MVEICSNLFNFVCLFVSYSYILCSCSLTGRTNKITMISVSVGVELQAEEMSIHFVGPLGLYQNNFLSPCKQCMILENVQMHFLYLPEWYLSCITTWNGALSKGSHFSFNRFYTIYNQV